MAADSRPTQFQVAVVGAGAAGLMAAIRSAELGRHTVLVEKNSRPGVKILMSGGTRCNLTHATDARGIIDAFGNQGRFLHSPLAALSPDGLVALFESEGLRTKTEETGKIFPVTNRATDVLAALVRRFDRSGATLELHSPVTGINREDDRFRLNVAGERCLLAKKLVITTGGQSYPGCGTTGDGYAWLRDMGHDIIMPRPALVPLTTAADWAKQLRGVTLPDVEVAVVDPNGGTLDRRRGGFLFTHFGLSGPVVMDASRAVTAHPSSNRLTLQCDFLPGVGGEQLATDLRRQFHDHGKKQVVAILAAQVPRRLAESLVDVAGVSIDRRGAEVSRGELAAITDQLKQTRLPITGTMGFKKAEVTAGGVALDQVNSRDMQSRIVPGLYLAGEILDLDGPIGGYNFQAAFSTGWLAGT